MPLKQYLIRQREKEKSVGFFINAVSYRVARPVTKAVRYPTHGYCYPLCPRCSISLEREYMGFCDRCGQKLNWDYFDYATIVDAPIIKQVGNYSDTKVKE